MRKKTLPDVDVFTHMGHWISRVDARYYSTTLKGNIVIGTAEELIELIDEYLLDDA